MKRCQRIRAEIRQYLILVELPRWSSKLVQERLGLEQQMEDMQATHLTKMDQMSSRGTQFGSYQVEQLSPGVGAAVTPYRKMFRPQFRGLEEVNGD